MEMRKIYRTDEVYGVSREIPLNYVEREKVDEQFISDLSVGKHIVIYGSSKQGKTSLRKNSLNEDEYVLVQCQNTWGLDKLAEAILKAIGMKVELSSERTVESKAKLNASVTAKFKGVFSAGLATEVESKHSTSETTRAIEIDPSDPNDLVAAFKLVEFSKYIVLEDFHYLPKETQENYAFFLKTIHERSEICFIVVAVWREENRLIVFNGDLAGRVVSVDADSWTDEELQSVIARGEKLLNIKFTEGFKADLITASLGSVYIVQEACRLACELCGVRKTELETATLKVPQNAVHFVKQVVGQSGARYQAFLNSFSGGFQDTNLEMYRWILYPILISDVSTLEEGLKYRFIRETLERVHPKGESLNPGNVTQALTSVPALQSKKNIKPFVLDYDQTELRLSIVDRGFLIWLSTRDRKSLVEDLGMNWVE